ncbi:CRISPR-associated helicase/endonuclease Cas3 [Caldisericum exile]|uniref:CRISPR-associated protein n=1 Tax=Caldisericum exile (strain DSM 21853 / NBRC 104410 / AZM16c01) TaxID=511051 RepID=A0A7U6GDH4_CALEA|nr:CRISPR-associated helicase/endonuclease Cas3 [Caldisericum exile]BAL80398.1 putative CRISPR-associated protein [Caldisericum exile AZM16c01]
MTIAKVFFKENGQFEIETLEQHTDNLLKNYENFKTKYEGDLSRLELGKNFLELLRIACIFHDLGKVSSAFQNKVKRLLKKNEEFHKDQSEEIPHNFLSVAFLPDQNLLNLSADEEYYKLFYAIAFHHDRKINFTEQDLKKVINEDLSKKIEELSWIKKYGLSISENLWDNYYKLLDLNSSNIFNRIRRDREFILLKGLLHRLDHSSSAHLPVETEKIEEPRSKLVSYIKDNGSTLKDFQKEAEKYSDKNVILTASTGIGKTEFALNWIGEQKAFYTLPVRVSVNAMYERFAEIFGPEKVGLLHSDSLFYNLDFFSNKYDIWEEDSGIEEGIHRTLLSRQLSLPITVTTADQMFTSVFKWRGYEKIYGTLMYSKVIIDEPQSYSPQILAMIIKSLEEISDLGGKFCIISATNHPFVLDQLMRINNKPEIIGPVLDNGERHKLKIEDSEIEDLTLTIKKYYDEGKKIIVLVNTVNKAQEVFKKFKEIGNVKMLHSQFIQRDRRNKEKEIMKDQKESGPVIWITTQIIEASLNIDYDVLFTEISSLDSLIQRMGRIYRGRGRYISKSDFPNVFISSVDPSDNFKIYDKEIVSFTKDVLSKYDAKIITEDIKIEMMKNVYDTKRIEGTKYYKKFKEAFALLESGFESQTKDEAQKLFRDIANLLVIPENVYIENKEKIEDALSVINDKNQNLAKRVEAIKSFNEFTVSVPLYKVNRSQIEKKDKVYVVKAHYDQNMGLFFSNHDDDLFSNII